MFNRCEVTSLLPILPDTLRSLSLKGSEMHDSHIPLFLPLTKHLEELGLGHGLVLSDIRSTRSRHPVLVPAVQFLGTIPCHSKSLRLVWNVSNIMSTSSLVKRAGWCLKEAGRRYWLVRDDSHIEESKKDTGGRQWKWGANYWGMRKMPVVRAEVGGMYGHYMFKR
ncbi:hypothetical protein DID88_008813 [Monilinia fructigena]|nr:hypothetical protein DID88_008813 [Monilinia fructigena]